MRTLEIGHVVDPVTKWNPRKDGVGAITYVDISSIDHDSKTVETPTMVEAAEAPSRARQLVATGDVLISTVRPNLNAVAFVEPDLDGATASTGLCVLRPRAGDIDSRYLFHWVRTRAFVGHLVRLATGASYPAVSDKIVKAAPIPLPALREQRRIAAVLDAKDALRAKRREAVTKLETLIQAVFVDVFGDPTVDSEWPQVHLAEVCQSKGEYGANVPAVEFDRGKPRYLRITDIRSDGTLTDEAVGPGGTEGQWRSKTLSPGDVLFARSGATVGKTFLVRDGDASLVFAGYLIKFTPDQRWILPEYLYRCTRTEKYRRWVAGAATTVAQPNVNASKYAQLELLLPPIDLQRRFAAVVEGIRRHERRLLAQAEVLDTLFASLQQRAFRGEL